MTEKLESLEKQLKDGIGKLSFQDGQGLFFEYVREVLRIMEDYAKRFER